MVHGDFHGNNLMTGYKETSKEFEIHILDWEFVGVGKGTFDLAWFMILNVPPSIRKNCERRLLSEYYDKLIELGVDNKEYSREKCY